MLMGPMPQNLRFMGIIKRYGFSKSPPVVSSMTRCNDIVIITTKSFYKHNNNGLHLQGTTSAFSFNLLLVLSFEYPRGCRPILCPSDSFLSLRPAISSFG